MMDLDTLKFDDRGLIPAIVQDAETGKVLTLAYMNRESLKISLEKKLTCFWSRSRQELWLKGETSGNYQHIVELRADCDKDAVCRVAEGVMGIKLTAAKNNAPAVQAPADADAYIDFAPLAAFAEELRGTAMQMMFGYDLTLSVDAKLFGMMTLADVDISAKIGMDAQGQISVIVTINVNAGGGIFFGDTQTQLVIRGGNVYITRTQTSVYGESLGSTDDTPLETPVTSSRAMTMAYFTANIADQLYYALNVNEETLASLISLGEMMGGSGEPGDVGEMITFAVTEGGYSLGLDLGKMLGMNNSTVGILVNCGEVGGTKVITSVGIEASVMGLVSANISLTNNNPGQAVDMSSAAQTVGTIASALGCADEAALNALIASDGDGFVTDYPVDEPADGPAAEQAA